MLPYCTESNPNFSHEFTIEFDGSTAHIHCMAASDSEAFNAIEYDEVKEMVETAMIVGIKTVTLHTNFGVNIHTYSLKNTAAFRPLTIDKAS